MLLAPLAYAGPPDPGWIPGIYDEDDFDDVVGSATSLHTGLPGDLPAGFAPLLLSAGNRCPGGAADAPAPLLSTSHIRAPPSREAVPRFFGREFPPGGHFTPCKERRLGPVRVTQIANPG
jgi:hypothetical protein